MLRRFVRWITGRKMAEEAFNRFILPHVTRAYQAGIPYARVDELVRQAIAESDGVVFFPGTRLRDLVDTEIEGREAGGE
jgi:hypothetical protein